MYMVRHRVWSYTVQNLGFMIKVVKNMARAERDGNLIL